MAVVAVPAPAPAPAAPTPQQVQQGAPAVEVLYPLPPELWLHILSFLRLPELRFAVVVPSAVVAPPAPLALLPPDERGGAAAGAGAGGSAVSAESRVTEDDPGIAQFMAITGQDSQTSARYLEMAAGSVDTAVSLFYDGGGGAGTWG